MRMIVPIETEIPDLGILPPGKFQPPHFFVATLFRFVARFACVRIEDSSRNRFASTAYFAKPGFVGGECSGMK